ncbi:hypothetical protein HMPREF2537_02795 [Corynebacterium sp. HMSC074E01]|nr:hypothetical protein HMPREF2537_02795 [Corynebacterium sp. HMSC074E01]
MFKKLQPQQLSAVEIEQLVWDSTEPLTGAVETLGKSQKSTAEKQKELAQTLANLEQQIENLGLPEKELQHLQQQQNELKQQLQTLAQTTVGTSEYDKAQKKAAETIEAIISMLTSMGPAMNQIQQTLLELSRMYQATLEVAKHPVQLSKSAAESVSEGLGRQLKSSLKSEIRPVVSAAFEQVKDDVSAASDRAAERLAAERKRHEQQLEKMRELHEQQAELVAKIEKQTAQSQKFALWVITACISGVTAAAVLGFFGHGLLNVLGIPSGMGWLWTQVFDAGSWYAGLGWFIVALLVLAGLLWALFELVVRLWQAVDGVALYMDKRRE